MPAHPVPEPLIAYRYLRRDAGSHTRAVLEGHIRSFAEREGYELRHLLVSQEGSWPAARTAGETDDGVDEMTGLLATLTTPTVLVVGPARHALVALHQTPGVRVLTLAQVRPTADPTPDRRRLARRRGRTR